MCSNKLLCFVMSCITKWIHIIYDWASCRAYVVVSIVFWFFVSTWFLLDRVTKAFWSDELFDYVGSSASWVRSSSKRDQSKMIIFQDTNTIIAMLVVSFLSLWLASYNLNVSLPTLPWKASNLSITRQTTVWLCYRLLSLLIALLALGAVASMCKDGFLVILQYYCYLI